MKIITIALLIAALVGCFRKEPLVVQQSGNPGLKLDLMFEKDGQAVYRFEDGIRVVYVVLPKGDTTSVHTGSCGKGCAREVVTQSLKP